VLPADAERSLAASGGVAQAERPPSASRRPG